MTKHFEISSVKSYEEFYGTKKEAMERAKKINEELQPSYGMTVYDVDGNQSFIVP